MLLTFSLMNTKASLWNSWPNQELNPCCLSFNTAGKSLHYTGCPRPTRPASLFFPPLWVHVWWLHFNLMAFKHHFLRQIMTKMGGLHCKKFHICKDHTFNMAFDPASEIHVSKWLCHLNPFTQSLGCIHSPFPFFLALHKSPQVLSAVAGGFIREVLVYWIV